MFSTFKCARQVSLICMYSAAPIRTQLGNSTLSSDDAVELPAVVMAQLREQPDDDDSGAPGIEIAFELASPQVPPSALAPGQESEASAASTAQAEQQAKPKDSELETPLPESKNADLNATKNR
jgi:hypothetical protein